MGFLGYPRPDGSAGIRNHVALLASVSCANGVVAAVGRELPQVKVLTHTEGCGRGPLDLVNTTRTLMGLGRNPNVGAIIVVGLGCEFLKAPMIANEIKSTKKPTETLVIQANGGSQRTTERALELARKLQAELDALERQEFGWDKLTVGFEFGGASPAAAERAHPALGFCADWLVEQGARVLVPEIGEMVGDDPALDAKLASAELMKKVNEALDSRRKTALKVLSNDALGSLPKGGAGLASLRGKTRVTDLLEYGAPASKPGLYLMDTPESDLFAVTGMAAGGAQVIVQTTEHGNPAGFPITPVVKVATVPGLFEMMEDDIDLDFGTAGGEGEAARAGQELIDFIAGVAAGKKTKAEENEYEVMAIHTLGPAF